MPSVEPKFMSLQSQPPRALAPKGKQDFQALFAAKSKPESSASLSSLSNKAEEDQNFKADDSDALDLDTAEDREAGGLALNGYQQAPKTEFKDSKAVGIERQESPKALSGETLAKPEAANPQTPEVPVEDEDLGRRLAMKSFLQKMKEQTGVTPAELLKAFASLSPQELMAPPEQNVEKLVTEMGLEGEQKKAAVELFNKLLKFTDGEGSSAKLVASQRQIAAINQKEMEKKRLDNSLVELSAAFFASQAVKSDSKRPTEVSRPEVPQTFKPPTTSTPELAVQKSNPSLPMLAGLKAVQVEGSKNAQDGDQDGVSNIFSSNDLPTSDSTQNSSELLGASPLKTANEPSKNYVPSSAAMVNAQMSQATEDLSDADSFESGPHLAPMDTSSLAPVKGEMIAANAKDSNENKNSEGEANSSPDGSQFALSKEKPVPVAPKMTFTGPQEAKRDGYDANIKELINQAQFAIKKGGGEVKVQLHPEGLGDVSMKVRITDGQVSVEMLASNSDAKHLIEKSLGDLKANLASHKLSVDQIKVDVARDLNQQFQNQQDENSRNFARQFLQDFRQNNQAWRQDFYDIPGARVVKGQTQDKADNAYLQPKSKSSSDSSSRRLNLVA